MPKTEEQRFQEYQVQLRRIAARREAGAEQEIRKEYQKALPKLQALLAKYYTAYGSAEDSTMTQGDLRAAGQYRHFLQDVVDHLDDIAEPVDKQIRQTIEDTYTTCCNGMVHAVKQYADGNVSLQDALSGLSAATPETVRNIVENPMDKLTLSTILDRRRAQIVSSIKKTLEVGLANGDSYARMAKQVEETLDSNYKKAMRIVRTESNRAINQSFQDVMEEASDMLLGSDYIQVKEWCSRGDGVVRDAHNHLNGKRIHVLDKFRSVGAEADCPGAFGLAEEDINCRCYLLYSFVLRSDFIALGGVIPEFVLQKESELQLTFEGNCDIIETNRFLRANEELGNHYKTALEEKFRTGTDIAKAVYDKFIPAGGAVIDIHSKRAYYLGTIHKVYLDETADSKNPRGAGSTWFHEHGHYIDCDNGYISRSKDFRNAIKKDVNTYERMFKKSNSLLTIRQARKKIADEFRSNFNMTHSIQDIFGGVRKVRYSDDLYGHDAVYWKKQGDYGVCLEAFAHMFEASFSPEKSLLMEKYLPTAWEEFQKILGGLI